MNKIRLSVQNVLRVVSLLDDLCCFVYDKWASLDLIKANIHAEANTVLTSGCKVSNHDLNINKIGFMIQIQHTRYFFSRTFYLNGPYLVQSKKFNTSSNRVQENIVITLSVWSTEVSNQESFSPSLLLHLQNTWCWSS